MLAIGLIEPSAFDGSFQTSAFKFQRHGLQSLELQIDNQPITNHPIKMNEQNGMDFFWNYLKNTNRFLNVFSNGSLSYKNYMNSNFLTFVNLKAEGHTNGQLLLRLKFETLMNKKLFCLFIPIYEKKLIFDSYLNVQVEN